MYVVLQILQMFGVLIPVVGYVVLLDKRVAAQATPALHLTNIGCLILNIGFTLFSFSESKEVAAMALNLQYLGSVIFYDSFILYTTYWYKFERKRIIEIPFYIMESAFMWTMWKTGTNAISETVGIYSETSTENVRRFIYLNIRNVDFNSLHFYLIRYGVIALCFVMQLIYSVLEITHMPNGKRRKTTIRIAAAELIIIVSIFMQIFTPLIIDVTPLFASLSILSIILGIMSGSYFSVIDSGKSWLMDNIRSVLVICDVDYNYQDSNAYAREVFPELTKTVINFPVPDELKAILQDESENYNKDGQYFRKSVRKMYDKNELQGYALQLLNVTEAYHLMTQKEEAYKAAREANIAKSQFMSNMSHEIRTPMNAIVGMTDILLREEQQPKTREYLENIRSSGDALLSIINDILDFSKIESGKMEIVEDKYEPASLLSDLSMIFLNRIGAKDIELIYDVDPALPSVLFGDAKRIRQIIINIVTNAIKFTEHGFVRVTVKCESSDEDVLLSFSVQDSGMGIRSEDMDKIFGSFSQVDTKKNREKEGTGLGLPISKQLTELMHGTIGVESEYGKGSNFFFTIPQKVVNPEPAAALRDSSGKPVIAGKFSMQSTEETFRKLAEDYGLTTVSADDVLEGSERADFLFTDDINMNRGFVAAEVVILLNPMLHSSIKSGLQTLYKPLYSINFCNVLNHETSHTAEDTVTESFVADGASILLVDDTPMNLTVTIGLLEPFKMNVDIASNGKEAIEMITNTDYDLVLMDHMMPVMDGVEATRYIRELGGKYADLPIVALSANATSEAQKMFSESGFNDFVSKPIRMKELCKCLLEYIPSDKITFVSAENAGFVGGNHSEGLPEIEGIDPLQGVEYSGSEKMFIQLLGDFYKLVDMKCTKIEKCLNDGLLKDYTIEVHAFKSTLRMLGAMELSERFKELEELGNAGDTEALEEKTPGALEELRALKDRIAPYACTDDGSKEMISPEELREALEQFIKAMDDFDLDKADAQIKILENHALPKELFDDAIRLSALAADVAMEESIALAKEMLAKCS